MKSNTLAYAVLFLMTLTLFNQAEAIGGRGGGGGGRGGGGRAGGGGGARQMASPQSRPQSRPQARPQEMSRAKQMPQSPSMSMSRATQARPNNVRQGGGASMANARPSQAQVQQFMQQRPGQTSGQGNRQALQSQLQRYTQLPTSPANRSMAQGQSLKNSLPQLNRTNAQSAAQAARSFNQQHPNAGNWFNNSFFADHNLSPNYLTPNSNLWGRSNWATTAAWMGLAATAAGYPAYYYGYDGAYTDLTGSEASAYQPQENVYVSTQPAQSYYQPTSAYQPTTAYSNAQGDNSAVQGDWIPLGVFAVGSTASQAPYSNMTLQLALSKDGNIAGTYYNSATNQAHEIEGLVDKSTQKAAWKLSDRDDSPVATTGIYNLTQDVAQVEMHFPNGTDQNKVLVRINQS